MKRFSKSMLGVTLLEIMLVLAVAAMIIVMSVRYYQSATAGQQVNATLEQIQAITAAADGIAQGNNSYATVTSAAVAPMLPGGKMTTVWGSSITITTPTATGYKVTIPSVPQNVCSQIVAKLASNTKYTTVLPATAGSCVAGNTNSISYTYDSTK